MVQFGNSSNVLEMQIDLDRMVQRLSNDRLTSSGALTSLMNQVLDEKNPLKSSDANLQLVNFNDVMTGLVALAAKFSIPLPSLNANSLIDFSGTDKSNLASQSIIGLMPPTTPAILTDRGMLAIYIMNDSSCGNERHSG